MTDPELDDGRDLWRRWGGARSRPGPGECPDAMLLAAWLDGRCDSSESERVEAHLAVCEACLAAVVELRTPLDEAATPVSLRMVERAAGLVPRWRAATLLRLTAAAAVVVAACGAGFLAGDSAARKRWQAETTLAAELTLEPPGAGWLAAGPATRPSEPGRTWAWHGPDDKASGSGGVR